MTEPAVAADRHASWLELFFDLVVVVAVSQLAHLLHGAEHGPSGLQIVTFFALYLAIWLVWTTFTLYSNVLAERVRVRSMFLGMAGIAVMAATVPHVPADRANLFAGAYLVTSGLGTGAFTRSGQVLLSWGAATRNAGLAPWIVSFWVDDPWGKLSLWLLGLAMTLWFSVLSGRGDGAEVVARLNRHLRRRRERRARGTEVPSLVVATVDAAHLGERLGLFVIIVLGEAMLQLVGAWADVDEWTPGGGRGLLLLLAVGSGFTLLVVLWTLNVRHAFTEEHPYPPAVVLPAHFVVISAITTIAAGLGAVAGASAGHLPGTTRWLLCAGVSVFLLMVTVLGRVSRLWPVTAAAVALPLAAGVAGAWLPAAVVAAVLLVAAGGQMWNLRGAGTGH
jgi:low temperature requirement protein LtrA